MSKKFHELMEMGCIVNKESEKAKKERELTKERKQFLE